MPLSEVRQVGRGGSCVDLAKRAHEIGLQLFEVELGRDIVASDQHIVPALMPVGGQNEPSNLS